MKNVLENIVEVIPILLGNVMNILYAIQVWNAEDIGSSLVLYLHPEQRIATQYCWKEHKICLYKECAYRCLQRRFAGSKTESFDSVIKRRNYHADFRN